MRKWTPAVPIAAALAFWVTIYSRLPEQLHPELGALLPFALPDSGDTLPRAVAAVFLPGIAILLWAFLAWGARLTAPQRPFPAWLLSEDTDARAMQRFASTFSTIIFTMTSGVCAAHVMLLGASLGWPSWTLQLFTAVVGVALLTVGNVIPRSRPNWIVGIRTKGTLASAAVWTRTHRYAGMFMMVTGALVIVASVVAPSYALLVTLGGIVLSLPIAHALGARNGSIGAASVVG